MTDNEIIKVLECCTTNESCSKCQLNYEDYCRAVLIEQAFTLIKRQQSEIERLNSLCASKDVIINSQEAEIEKSKNSPIIGSLCPMWKAEARVEAIKEFADSLFRKSQLLASSVYGTPEYGVFLKDIDALVVEMTGKEI